MLYRIIDPIKEGDLVVYVGCHVVQWKERVRPTVGFIPATKEELETALKNEDTP